MFPFARHCGYIKAKQDPEEEKMRFQHGHGERLIPEKLYPNQHISCRLDATMLLITRDHLYIFQLFTVPYSIKF